jgi:hypothetical protein
MTSYTQDSETGVVLGLGIKAKRELDKIKSLHQPAEQVHEGPVCLHPDPERIAVLVDRFTKGEFSPPALSKDPTPEEVEAIRSFQADFREVREHLTRGCLVCISRTTNSASA